MKITLIISSLGAGGAERVMSVMANHLAGQGEDVTLITLDEEALDFFSLDPGVRRLALGVARPSANLKEAVVHNFVRFKTLRRAIKSSKPDVIISFANRTNVVTLISGAGLKVPIIVSERSDPRQEELGFQWKVLRRMLYPLADAVVVQTESVRQWALQFVRKSPVWVIPNPVVSSSRSDSASSFSPVSKYTVTGMGRLVKVKGFDLLLRAFAKCSPNHPDWSLMILGDGDERENLLPLAEALGIENKLTMPGMIKDPEDFLNKSELFVLPSRYEGFPNALLEAMACALPVVSFDCPCGPAEIVRDGIDGILVPPENVESLSRAMDNMMKNKKNRKQMGGRAKEVIHRFSAKKVMESWTKVIEDVSAR